MDVNFPRIDLSLTTYNRRGPDYRELFFHFRTNPGHPTVVQVRIEN